MSIHSWSFKLWTGQHGVLLFSMARMDAVFVLLRVNNYNLLLQRCYNLHKDMHKNLKKKKSSDFNPFRTNVENRVSS